MTQEPDSGTRRLHDVAPAAALLRAGELVAFPTETVYGLGADALNPAAVARIFEAKGRPRFNPLIVHVPSLAAARLLADLPDWAEALAAAFWPGALTLLVPHRGSVPDLVTAGMATVGLRVPAHPLALALLEATGPLAAPSANPSGRVSPTRADHVLSGLDGRIAAVLDGGPTEVGLESTIIGGPEPTLLRPGGIPAEAIEAALGVPLLAHAPPANAPTAPGQLASHYAPSGAVRLDALTALAGEVHLGFGPVSGDVSLSETGDLREAAARLFALLRELDTGAPIAVAPIPETGLGVAINDRLRRAAAPR
ncbi:MAG: L-threonylcarbamoyladenylate synthase [Pseudomonadota bacterium]